MAVVAERISSMCWQRRVHHGTRRRAQSRLPCSVKALLWRVLVNGTRGVAAPDAVVSTAAPAVQRERPQLCEAVRCAHAGPRQPRRGARATCGARRADCAIKRCGVCLRRGGGRTERPPCDGGLWRHSGVLRLRGCCDGQPAPASARVPPGDDRQRQRRAEAQRAAGSLAFPPRRSFRRHREPATAKRSCAAACRRCCATGAAELKSRDEKRKSPPIPTLQGRGAAAFVGAAPGPQRGAAFARRPADLEPPPQRRGSAAQEEPEGVPPAVCVWPGARARCGATARAPARATEDVSIWRHVTFQESVQFDVRSRTHVKLCVRHWPGRGYHRWYSITRIVMGNGTYGYLTKIALKLPSARGTWCG